MTTPQGRTAHTVRQFDTELEELRGLVLKMGQLVVQQIKDALDGLDGKDDDIRVSNARNGCLFTTRGKLIIKHARYKEDARPIDESCSCFTCAHYSRAYLRHLFMAGEILYSTLATLHNLYRYLDIMRAIRQAIVLGTFPKYLDSVRSQPVEDPS